MFEGDTITLLFGSISIAVAIGFLGERLFKRTGIPDVIPIMILGLLVGPILNLINPEPLVAMAPLFGSIALLIILFNSGLNLDFYAVVKQAPRAAMLAIMTFGLGTLSTMVIAIYVLKMEPMLGILLGTILGGSSSIIVIPYLQQMKVGERVKTILSLESTITDILAVVATLTIIKVIQIGATGSETMPITQMISSSFSIGIVTGLLLGLIWLWVFPKISKDAYNYMMTLFIAFLTYSITEFLGGSGPLSALVFGLILGNGRSMSQIFKFDKQVTINTDITRFNSEISFLVRSIFFVYIGIIATIGDIQLTIVGIGIALLLLSSRLVAAPIVTWKTKIEKQRNMIIVMFPRGLGAAVLASLPFTMGIPNTEIFVNVVFVVIFATIAITVAGTFTIKNKKNKLEDFDTT